jgi:hypothetical protein
LPSYVSKPSYVTQSNIFVSAPEFGHITSRSARKQQICAKKKKNIYIFLAPLDS